MLENYFAPAFRLVELRECPDGEYMDAFADGLRAAGYKRKSAQLLLRGAAHLSQWASIHKVQVDQFDQRVLDRFADHLPTCSCACPFRGRDRRNLKGAKRFVEHLQKRGLTPQAEAEALPALAEAFSDWLRRHRGTTESTIAQ